MATLLLLCFATAVRAEPTCIDHPELQLVAAKRASRIALANRLRISGGVLVGVGGLFIVIAIALGIRSSAVVDYDAETAMFTSIGLAVPAVNVGVPLLISGGALKSHAENPATVFSVAF